MVDGRLNNGGHSTKGYAGRKPKEDEDRIRGLSISALESIYGSEEKAFEYIAEKAKDSFPHLKLLFEYAYGKPKQKQDIEIATNKELPLFLDMNDRIVKGLSDSALREIITIMESCEAELND
tara:strand:- start:649 stop:1014 length:366 start_codon:yes stop_codon:yes gene_type:complete